MGNDEIIIIFQDLGQQIDVELNVFDNQDSSQVFLLICSDTEQRPGREGLEVATFEQKRQLIDLLDVRGKLAIENDEKVVYIKCILGQQLLSVARTSPLSSTGNRQQIYILTTKLMIGSKQGIPGAMVVATQVLASVM